MKPGARRIRGGNGLTVQLGAGTVHDGDSFTARVVGPARHGGDMGALDWQLFSGSSARDIRPTDEVLLDQRFSRGAIQPAGRRRKPDTHGPYEISLSSPAAQRRLGGGEGYANLVSDVGPMFKA